MARYSFTIDIDDDPEYPGHTATVTRDGLRIYRDRFDTIAEATKRALFQIRADKVDPVPEYAIRGYQR